ncbi:hypothetical protein HDU97_005458 [Phlyctochytrium planicorne]|nr:hypothetical protein HDU97_005458 [Phlyctochytrium planicorne]
MNRGRDRERDRDKDRDQRDRLDDGMGVTINVKETQQRCINLSKMAAKCRSALNAASTSFADLSSSIEALNPPPPNSSAINDIKWCMHAQSAMEKNLKELADRIQRNFEDPLLALIDTLAQAIQQNEKANSRSLKDLNDRLRKAETDVRRHQKSSSSTTNDLNSSLQHLSECSDDVEELKRFQSNSLKEMETKRWKSVGKLCKGLVKDEEAFGQSVVGASGRAEGARGLEDEDDSVKPEDVSNALSTGNFSSALRLSLGGPLLPMSSSTSDRTPFYLTPSQQQQQSTSSTTNFFSSLPRRQRSRSRSRSRSRGRGGRRSSLDGHIEGEDEEQGWKRKKDKEKDGGFSFFGRSASGGGILGVLSGNSGEKSGSKPAGGSTSTSKSSGGRREEDMPEGRSQRDAQPATTEKSGMTSLFSSLPRTRSERRGENPSNNSSTIPDPPKSYFSLDRGLGKSAATSTPASAKRESPPVVISTRTSSLALDGSTGNSGMIGTGLDGWLRGEVPISEAVERRGRKQEKQSKENLNSNASNTNTNPGNSPFINLDLPGSSIRILPPTPASTPPPTTYTIPPGFEKLSSANSDTPTEIEIIDSKPQPPPPAPPASTKPKRGVALSQKEKEKEKEADREKEDKGSKDVPSLAPVQSPTTLASLLKRTPSVSSPSTPSSTMAAVGTNPTLKSLGQAGSSSGSTNSGGKEKGRFLGGFGKRDDNGEERSGSGVLRGLVKSLSSTGLRSNAEEKEREKERDREREKEKNSEKPLPDVSNDRDRAGKDDKPLPRVDVGRNIFDKAGRKESPALPSLPNTNIMIAQTPSLQATSSPSSSNPSSPLPPPPTTLPPLPASAMAKKRGSLRPKKQVRFTAEDRPMVEVARFSVDGAPLRLRRAGDAEEEEWEWEGEEWDEEGEWEEGEEGESLDEEDDEEEWDEEVQKGKEVRIGSSGSGSGGVGITASVLAPAAGSSSSGKDGTTLNQMYPTLFARSDSSLGNTPVRNVTPMHPQIRQAVPTVYFPPQADVESEMGSVVDAASSVSSISVPGKAKRRSTGVDPNRFALGGTVVEERKSGEKGVKVDEGTEMVIALHAFAKRSGKEMSLDKGDVIVVHKRQGTWIYGTKVRRRALEGVTDKKDEGKVEKEVGWIPVAFVAKYSLA